MQQANDSFVTSTNDLLSQKLINIYLLISTYPDQETNI